MPNHHLPQNHLDSLRQNTGRAGIQVGWSPHVRITSLDQKPETMTFAIQRSPPSLHPLLSYHPIHSSRQIAHLVPTLSHLHDVNDDTVSESSLIVERSARGKGAIFLRRPFNFPMNGDRRSYLDGRTKVPLSNCAQLCKLPESHRYPCIHPVEVGCACLPLLPHCLPLH